MKYHVLVAPERLTTEELKIHKLRGVFNEENTAYQNAVDKLAKTEKGNNDRNYYYLYDERSMKALAKKLKDGDEIVLHGEGQPFIIGLPEPSQYDLTGFKLAKLLKAYNIPDYKIDINLLACHSASQYKDMNFAKDTSEALAHVFHYKNTTVSGYTGYVRVKAAGKYSVSSALDRDHRGTHSDLESAKLTYGNGELMKKGRVLSDLSEISFDWAKKYIEKTHRAKEVVKFAKEATNPTKLIRSESRASFFKPSGELDSNVTTATNEIGRPLRSQSVTSVTEEPGSEDPAITPKFPS